MDKHWTEKMFVDYAHLFGAILEARVDQAKVEVLGLEKIFSDFHVPSSSLVLDLCCGIGRHSVELAERGYKVVGVDLSPTYINRARALAAERGVTENCIFIVGDIRQIGEVLSSYKEKFNAILSMWSSMGYYDEETDTRVLMQLRELAVSKGILIIDTVNRDSLTKNFRPIDITQIGEDLILIEENRLNLENSRMENTWRYYRQKDKDLKHLETFEFSHRVYSLHELKRQVGESGWAYQTCYGGFNSEPFTTDTRRMVLISQKP